MAVAVLVAVLLAVGVKVDVGVLVKIGSENCSHNAPAMVGALVSHSPVGGYPVLDKFTSTRMFPLTVSPLPLIVSPLLSALPPPAAVMRGPQFVPHQLEFATVPPPVASIVPASAVSNTAVAPPLLVMHELRTVDTPVVASL